MIESRWLRHKCSLKHGHKDLGLKHFVGVKIINLDGLSGIIHKHFLTATMLLAHDRIDLIGPFTVQMTKLAVLISVGILLFIFLPQKA